MTTIHVLTDAALRTALPAHKNRKLFDGDGLYVLCQRREILADEYRCAASRKCRHSMFIRAYRLSERGRSAFKRVSNWIVASILAQRKAKPLAERITKDNRLLAVAEECSRTIKMSASIRTETFEV